MIIDQLPEIGSIQTTDEMPVERGQTSYKTPVSKIFASPTLTGTPKAPTAGVSTNNTQIATTAFANRAANNAVSTFARPNLLDNWYFVGGGSQAGNGKLPINQRGNAVYTGQEYYIDRWWSNGTGKLTVNNGSITLEGTHTTYDMPLRQPLENPSIFVGHEVTLTVLVTAVSGTGGRVQMLGANGLNLSPMYGYGLKEIASPGLYTSTFSVPNDVGTTYPFFMVELQAKVSGSITVQAIKLELGPEQTLAHQENGAWVLNEIPNYEEQLIRCKTSTADSHDTYANQSIVYESPYHWGISFSDSPNLEDGQIDVYKMGRFAVASIRFKCLTNLSWYTLPGITLQNVITPAAEVSAAMISRNQEFVCPLMIETNGTIHFDTARADYWYTVTVCYMTV